MRERELMLVYRTKWKTETEYTQITTNRRPTPYALSSNTLCILASHADGRKCWGIKSVFSWFAQILIAEQRPLERAACLEVLEGRISANLLVAAWILQLRSVNASDHHRRRIYSLWVQMWVFAVLAVSNCSIEWETKSVTHFFPHRSHCFPPPVPQRHILLWWFFNYLVITLSSNRYRADTEHFLCACGVCFYSMCATYYTLRCSEGMVLESEYLLGVSQTYFVVTNIHFLLFKAPVSIRIGHVLWKATNSRSRGQVRKVEDRD